MADRRRATPHEAALFVAQTLRDAGHRALFAGGCVRDELLGRTPNDYDVATDAEPDAVHACFKRTLSVGEQFGIVIVRYRGEQIEVATFRADGDYSDGRRPDAVSYTREPADDAQRRDFTVNGLFYDPFAEEVIDTVGGVDDVVAGRIRAIGVARERFSEDRLRILRAPRFAAVLGFAIEDETAAAARAQAHEIESSSVSPERIRVELAKLLRCAGRARGWAWCRSLELLPVVLPASAPSAAHVERALAALPARGLPDSELPLLWATALSQVSCTEADQALRALRCSNKERAGALALLDGLEQALRFAELPLARQKRLLRALDAPALTQLVRAVSLARGGELEGVRYLQARLDAFEDESGPTSFRSKPLIGGRDLSQAGVQAGPIFGRVLPRVEDAQLEGRVTTREDALALGLALASTES